jgi:predicted transcriptional regulator
MKTLTINLPDSLARALEDFTESLPLTPEQFVAAAIADACVDAEDKDEARREAILANHA